MTGDQAVEVLNIFYATFPQVRASETTAHIWWESALQHTPYDLGRQIALDLVANRATQFPTPAAFNNRKTEINRQKNAMQRQVGPIDADGWEKRPDFREQFDALREKLGRPRKHEDA